MAPPGRPTFIATPTTPATPDFSDSDSEDVLDLLGQFRGDKTTKAPHFKLKSPLPKAPDFVKETDRASRAVPTTTTIEKESTFATEDQGGNTEDEDIDLRVSNGRPHTSRSKSNNIDLSSAASSPQPIPDTERSNNEQAHLANNESPSERLIEIPVPAVVDRNAYEDLEEENFVLKVLNPARGTSGLKYEVTFLDGRHEVVCT